MRIICISFTLFRNCLYLCRRKLIKRRYVNARIGQESGFGRREFHVGLRLLPKCGVAAFADLYGLDETLAKRLAAGFGGGVGRMRMMCGAVSAIVMLVGLDCGQTEGSDRAGKSACYKVVQELLAESKAQNGSLICAEILGIQGHEKAVCSYEASPRTAEYYKTRPCAAKVESAARIFADYLKKKMQNA